MWFSTSAYSASEQILHLPDMDYPIEVILSSTIYYVDGFLHQEVCDPSCLFVGWLIRLFVNIDPMAALAGRRPVGGREASARHFTFSISYLNITAGMIVVVFF